MWYDGILSAWYLNFRAAFFFHSASISIEIEELWAYCWYYRILFSHSSGDNHNLHDALSRKHGNDELKNSLIYNVIPFLRLIWFWRFIALLHAGGIHSQLLCLGCLRGLYPSSSTFSEMKKSSLHIKCRDVLLLNDTLSATAVVFRVLGDFSVCWLFSGVKMIFT